ncbi:MAG: flagellin [Oligoflexales bacterium]
MGLRIRTNIQSLVAQRNLAQSTDKASRHMEKLASGYRINRAADDAAGMAISEGLRADIRSLNQARRNANDGVSLLQVAEGGLEEINNIAIRLRELSIQAASDTVGGRERDYLNREFMQLKDEVDRIALSTEFNGTRLLVGKKELDPEMAMEQNGWPMEVQVGKDYLIQSDSLDRPNPVNIIRMDFGGMNASTEGENSLELGSAQNDSGTRIDTKVAAQNTINVLDQALNKIASFRGTIGSLQSRLESTDRNLAIGVEGLGAAKSRIKDADYAYETAEYTQASILTQSGASVLTQANQLPNVALKLLQ